LLREKKIISKKFNKYNLVIINKNLLFNRNRKINKKIKLLLITI